MNRFSQTLYMSSPFECSWNESGLRFRTRDWNRGFHSNGNKALWSNGNKWHVGSRSLSLPLLRKFGQICFRFIILVQTLRRTCRVPSLFVQQNRLYGLLFQYILIASYCLCDWLTGLSEWVSVCVQVWNLCSSKPRWSRRPLSFQSLLSVLSPGSLKLDGRGRRNFSQTLLFLILLPVHKLLQ